MSPKFLRRMRRMAFALITSAAVASSARAQTLGNDVGPPNAPVHPIDQAIENVGHVFDGTFDDRPCPIAKHKVWATGEYMLSWLSGMQVPPLITSSANGVPFGTAAVLGQPSTSILYGDNTIGNNPYSGARFSVGGWLTERYDRGVEVTGFLLGGRQSTFAASGTGAGDGMAVGRPIIVAATGNESVAYSAFANALAGSSTAVYRTDLWGVEANALARERLIGSTFITFLGGIRYLDLQQDLTLQDRSTPQGNNTIPLAGLVGINNPNIARVTDSFQTHNQFIGGQFGFRTNTEFRGLDLGFAAKLAIGGTNQVVNINGYSEALATNGQPILASPGGLLATSTNIGRYTREAFTMIPEVELKVGYKITDYLTAFVSWDYLYWSRIAQPGNQINRTVDLTKVPTSGLFAVAPGVANTTTLNSSNLTMNSIMFGATLKY